MNVLLASNLAMVGSADRALACERDLAGTWKSDVGTSMSFNRKKAKLLPKTDAFLAALLGHMTSTFTSDEVHTSMPDIEMPVAGKPVPFVGIDERKPHSVLFCSYSTIVWSARRSQGVGMESNTFNFTGPDTFWVYLGSTESKIPDLHTREYFRRMR